MFIIIINLKKFLKLHIFYNGILPSKEFFAILFDDSFLYKKVIKNIGIAVFFI